MESKKTIKPVEKGKMKTVSDNEKELRDSKAECKKCLAEIAAISCEMKRLRNVPEEFKKSRMDFLKEYLEHKTNLLDLNLGKIHFLRLKKISTEMIKCYDDNIKMLEITRTAMKPYILEWGTGFGNNKDFKVISKIIVDGQVFTYDDNPTLFDFINCGLGIVLNEDEKNIGYYYDEPVLAKIPTTVEGKSLEDLRIEAIKSYAYYCYLLSLKKQLCVRYGHEWRLKKSSTNPIANKFEIECVCSCCKEVLKEEFDSEQAMKASFGIKRRVHEMNMDLIIPKFRLEDYFVKVNNPNRGLKSSDEIGRLLIPYDWYTENKK